MFVLQRLRSNSTQVLVTLIVFSLSSGVLGGILFYTDSAGPFVLSELAQDIPVHMRIHFTRTFYSQGDGSVSETMNVLDGQDDIASSEHILAIDGHWEHMWFSDYRRLVYLGVENSFFETYSDCIEVSPRSMALNNNGCYVEQSLLNRYGLEIGDTFNVTVIEAGSGWGDETLARRLLEVQGSFKSKGLWGEFGEGERALPILRVIMPKQTMQNRFEFLGRGLRNALHDRIWIELRSSFLQQPNPSRAEQQIDILRKTINQDIAPDAAITELSALSVIRGFASWRSNMTAIALAFSIPSIVMGVILVYYTTELVSDRRRREVGMLRVRGASSKAATSWVLSTALLTGFIGAIGAVLIGLGSAFLSGCMRGFLTLSLTATSFTIILQPRALLVVFGFAFLLGVLVSVPSTVRILIMSPSDAHREIHREERTEAEESSSPIIDASIASLSGVFVAVLLPNMGLYAASSQTPFTLLMLVVAFGAFILSTIRFLSRPTAYLKTRVLQRITSPEQIGGVSVIGGYSQMKRKSEALGVMFIALLFTAATFSAISSSTGSNHVKNLIAFDVGGDIVVDVSTSFENSTLELGEEFSRIPGVSRVSGMLVEYSQITYKTIGPYATIEHERQIQVFGVQPSEWASIAFLLPSFAEGDPKEAISSMQANRTNVLSSFRPVIGYSVKDDSSYESVYGDTVGMKLPGQTDDSYFNVTIVDILSNDESDESQSYLPGYPEADEFIVMNLNLMHQKINSSLVSRFYVGVSSDANHTSIANQLREIGGRNVVGVTSTKQQQQGIMDTRSAHTIHGIYSLNVLFTLIFLSIGMGLIAVQKNESLRKQFSVVRSLGAESSSVQKALLFDGLLSVGIAGAIGIPFGVVLSLLVLGTPLTYTGVSGNLQWHRLPLTLNIPQFSMLVIVALSIIMPLLVTYVITNRYLDKCIAEGLRTAG